jgi:hypothetical protein
MNKKEQYVIGLKCRLCNKGKYREVTIDLPYKGILIPHVKALQCDNCREILFTLKHHEAIRQRVKALASPLEFERTISSAGNMETINIPKDIVRFLNLKVGTPIRIYVEGKRRIIIEPKKDELLQQV